MSRNFQSATAQLTHVVQLARAGIHSLEQLVDLLVAHLLAQVREDVAELADADEAREFLVEDLEAAASPAHLALKILDLGQGGVLATGAQEIAQVGESDTAVAALVEEGEGLLEVGALRLLVGHAASVDCVFCGWMEWLCAEECSDCDGASRSAAARECVDGVLLTVRCGDLAFAGSLADKRAVSARETEGESSCGGRRNVGWARRGPLVALHAGRCPCLRPPCRAVALRMYPLSSCRCSMTTIAALYDD
ncbi:hypothetical protein L1887_49553 [Cichorium endivia]|nr:hypothetical protein L1887_49553 [Cichorium endivia]